MKLACLLAAAGIALAQAPGSVTLQYQHEEDRSELSLADIAFSSPQRGIAAGVLVEKSDQKPVALLTSDGGGKWTPVELDKQPVSLFALDDAHYWLVTTGGLYFSSEAGREWRKISSPRGLFRVWFLNPQRGFGVGMKKQVWETNDGGKTWTTVQAAKAVQGNPEITRYTGIAFVNDSAGIITGQIVPKRRSEERELPAWIDPGASRRNTLPSVDITLETRDGGKTWASSVASLFGHITRVRLSPLGWGLGLVEFAEGFEYPAEVHRLSWTNGKSVRIYRDKTFKITDIAIADQGGPAYLAGVEQLGPLIDSPVPRRVRVMISGDLQNWRELEVDYRATATRVATATAGRDVWIATDTGMILKIQPK